MGSDFPSLPASPMQEALSLQLVEASGLDERLFFRIMKIVFRVSEQIYQSTLGSVL